MINSTTFDYPYRTQDAYMRNMKDSVIYGNTLLVFWGFFMVIAFLNNVFSRLLNIERGATNKYVTMFRKWFILPATFGKMHAEPFRFFGIALNITPVRWMYLLVVLYSILNVVFLWPQVDIFEENTKIGTPRQQWARYIADRSGIFATVMMPSLYLFAGRNNILQYFSGWQFETFNVIHRWTGRWMFIQSAVHGLTYSLVYVYQEGGYATYVESVWHVEAIIWGSVATILAAAILFQAFYPFRHYFYEIFKILHIALAAVFLAYTYLHVYAYNYYQWMFYKYLWATVGIWVVDHVFRIFRILYSGLFATASVKIVGGAAIIRVKPMISWTPKPGQYAYLYVMRHNFWESHPFSVVGKENGEYVFVTKAEAGMTQKLLKSVAKAPDATKNKMNVWVEGFYGESAPVSRFDTILLVAGGIGITAIVSYATALANKAREGQHIILYWILRNETDLGWVKSLIDAIAATRRVEIHIFVTGAHDSSVAALSDVKNSDSASASATDSEKANSLDGSKISWTADDVTYGQRPDMNAVIASTVHEANGSVAVMMCGPGSLSDICRQAVAQNVDKGKARVEYFEEVFSWA
ncbi:ferric reductase NAD binding domain-containing protein [Myxozyma melibiosi]|uniref:Ferric reductase NAD binding domain-containing protein n=1 Tax=Myxozyma melibiosi TaxID=54550 RepID=A0ABR1FF27_9ASCO